jgi:hypothetical protein
MKYRSTLLIRLLAFSLLAIYSCTGYNDGPTLSFVAPAKKMARTWQFQEVILYQTEVTANYAGDFIEFEEDGGFSSLDAERIISFPPFTISDTLPVLGRGEWDFLDKKNRLEMFFTYNYQDQFVDTLFYQEEMYQQWTITRLTEEEFWMENDSMRVKLLPKTQ